MSRADLLALTQDALAALANRGLVKRAAKEAAGAAVTCVDDVVEARFADGTRTTLPPGVGLDGGTCSCGAPGLCRHRIAAVLAYQETGAAPAAAAWSPGEFTDDELTARFGARVVKAARRTMAAGYSARVRRDPVSVAMAAATVRFLVPGDLAYVDCDARDGGELVVLAVWAFRVADAEHPGEADVTVDIGVVERGSDGDVLSIVDDLLVDGVATAGPVLAAALGRERDALDRAGLRWPAAAADDLVQQLTAYAERGAAHNPVRVAELITELHARHRVPPSPRALGTEEPARTPLKQVRMVGLGARVTEAGTEVYLAHPATSTVLVLRATGRRVAGTTVGALATGNVVSEAAVRSASRVVRFSAGALARTAVTPLGDAWQRLPPGLLVEDVPALLADLADLPPRLVRARVEAEHVRVIPLAEIGGVEYHPGAQRLTATATTPDGATITITLDHRAPAPAAIDALARALATTPTAITGPVRRGREGLEITPLAVLTSTGPLVPDLAPADSVPLPPSATPEPDPLSSALTLLAEAAHRGLHHLPPTYPDRVNEAATALTTIGLPQCAHLLHTWGADPTPTTWINAAIRLFTAAELR
ncbi:SWIM zinc finger family protein [Actinokineospora sp. NPDC004072]